MFFSSNIVALFFYICEFEWTGLIIMSRYISTDLISANGAYVGLAPPGDAGSWQRECKVFFLHFCRLSSIVFFLFSIWGEAGVIKIFIALILRTKLKSVCSWQYNQLFLFSSRNLKTANSWRVEVKNVLVSFFDKSRILQTMLDITLFSFPFEKHKPYVLK